MAAFLVQSLASFAPKPKPSPALPVDLEIVSPACKPDKPFGVMYTSSTALEFTATIKKTTLGIATDQATRSYVGKGFSGWIVIADPDGCFEIALSPDTPINSQRECLAQLYPNIPPDSFLNCR